MHKTWCLERDINMFFSDNEKQIMQNLFLSINHNVNQKYILRYSDGDVIEGQVDTCYETDNGLEIDDPNYEEYYACAMKIVKIIVDKTKTLKENSLIEINYRNYPQQIQDLQGNIL
ncbi:MAG: hypothetical protein OSJ73_16240 [Lachnospiraceae bacterium]|nr:hypothetical protein [Lachnospiraceae bacterium]